MDFSSMREKELREYLDFLLRQYRLADAFWFLAVEETFGTEAAVKLNEDVWPRLRWDCPPGGQKDKEPVCHGGRGRSRRYGSSVVLSLDHDYRI